MCGVVHDLDVEDGGEAAEALGPDAEAVDLFVELDAEGFDGGFGASAMSSCMSMGSMRDSLAMTMAFSAVPPMPMPSMPGGHQPAPMVGTVLRTQSTTESEGLSMANLLLASLPPPLEATVMSTAAPWINSTTTMAGVLSPVLRRVKAGRRGGWGGGRCRRCARLRGRLRRSSAAWSSCRRLWREPIGLPCLP